MLVTDLLQMCRELKGEGRWLLVSGDRIKKLWDKGKRARLRERGYRPGPFIMQVDSTTGEGKVLPDAVIKWLETGEKSCDRKSE